jgi:SAM-dependent methyltransferase
MTSTASYDSIASIYDQYWGQEFAEFAQDAFRTHLANALPGNAAVLDLCCGTGLLIAHLDALGYRAFGVDESLGMLSIASRSAPRAHLKQADMAGFRWNTEFDAAVCLYNSVNHTRSLDHLCAALANVEKHLHPRGLFLFDYVSREAFETMWESNEEIDAEDGRGTVRYAYDRNTRRATCFIDHQRTAIRQISLEREQVYQALHYAGLAVVREAPMSGPAPIRGRRLILAGKAHRGETA